MTEEEVEQIIADRDWWRDFEVGEWTMYGFTERSTASFRNSKTGRTIQLDGEFLHDLTDQGE